MSYCDTIKELRTRREMEPVEISDELLIKAIDCVRYASSAMNCQVIRYALINDEKKDAIFVLTNLPTKHQIPNEQAPSAYIVMGSSEEGKKNPYYSLDLGIASQVIREYLHYQGLTSLCVYSFDRIKTKELIGIADFYPELLIPIGKSQQKINIEDSENEVGYYRDENNVHTIRKLTTNTLVVNK